MAIELRFRIEMRFESNLCNVGFAWSNSSKPEMHFDIRVSPRYWFRLFYFRYRPANWWKHMLANGMDTSRGRVIWDRPGFYAN